MGERTQRTLHVSFIMPNLLMERIATSSCFIASLAIPLFRNTTAGASWGLAAFIPQGPVYYFEWMSGPDTAVMAEHVDEFLSELHAVVRMRMMNIFGYTEEEQMGNIGLEWAYIDTPEYEFAIFQLSVHALSAFNTAWDQSIWRWAANQVEYPDEIREYAEIFFRHSVSSAWPYTGYTLVSSQMAAEVNMTIARMNHVDPIRAINLRDLWDNAYIGGVPYELVEQSRGFWQRVLQDAEGFVAQPTSFF